MSKEKITWQSPALGGRELTFCRYGVSGQPLLLFPTAGGDAEEPERFHMITAIGEFLEQLREVEHVIHLAVGAAERPCAVAVAAQVHRDHVVVVAKRASGPVPAAGSPGLTSGPAGPPRRCTPRRCWS